MRIYNKRKFFIGIGEFILSIVAFVTMFITRTIDIKIYCSQCDRFYSWYCEYFEKSFKIRYGRRYYRRK